MYNYAQELLNKAMARKRAEKRTELRSWPKDSKIGTYSCFFNPEEALIYGTPVSSEGCGRLKKPDYDKLSQKMDDLEKEISTW